MNDMHILIVDDERNLVNSLIYGLGNHGITGHGALDAAEALQQLDTLEPDLMLLDLRLPGASGLDVLRCARERRPDLPVIIISAHGDIAAAVQALKAGAEDFLTKPFDLDDLAHTIKRSVSRQYLASEVAYRRSRNLGEHGEFIGESTAIKALREQVRIVARSSARTILILGESGVGKALVARAIHSQSQRVDGPFIEINSASLPAHLLEAELFGAERGAFTGAVRKRAGLVQLANGGTLFLDEIGELAVDLQAKLLHFLDNHRYRPVGSGRERSADVRVVAATNRNIAAEVETGRVRADLFYRLNVMPIHVPRLAVRGEDVMVLAEHFAKAHAAEEGCEPIRFEPEVRAHLLAYPWPGNVRELRNLVERLTILHPGEPISSRHLPVEFHLYPKEEAATSSIDASLEHTERELLLRALAEVGGRKGRAAEVLGISRHALKRKLRRLGIP